LGGCCGARGGGRGVCSQTPPRAKDTPCTPVSPLPDCVAAQCNGTGVCGEPATPGTPCSSAPGECFVPVCNGTTCGILKGIGAPCTDTTPGDCFDAVCNGGGTCTQTLHALTPDTPCTDTTPGDCFEAVCDAGGVCNQARKPLTANTPCTDSTPGDCFVAQCNGSGTCNQTADLQQAGAACGDQTATDCDLADICDAQGACQPNFVATGTACTDTEPGDCFVAQCNGSGTCNQTAAFQQAGAPCGDQTATDCDLADICDAQGACQPNFVATGTACTDTQPGNCRAALCTGSGLCNQNAAPAPCPAPLVSEPGLLVMIGFLGLAGWFTLRRRTSRRP
jgi:hypothetical protein